SSGRIDSLSVPGQFCLSETKIPVFIWIEKDHRIADNVQVAVIFQRSHLFRRKRELNDIYKTRISHITIKTEAQPPNHGIIRSTSFIIQNFQSVLHSETKVHLKQTVGRSHPNSFPEIIIRQSFNF